MLIKVRQTSGYNIYGFVVGLTLTAVVYSGSIKCFGIIYLEYSELFDADSSKIAWIGTTHALCTVIVGKGDAYMFPKYMNLLKLIYDKIIHIS